MEGGHGAVGSALPANTAKEHLLLTVKRLEISVPRSFDGRRLRERTSCGRNLVPKLSSQGIDGSQGSLRKYSRHCVNEMRNLVKVSLTIERCLGRNVSRSVILFDFVSDIQSVCGSTSLTLKGTEEGKRGSTKIRQNLGRKSVQTLSREEQRHSEDCCVCDVSRLIGVLTHLTSIKTQ
jgi:hypothetical protein